MKNIQQSNVKPLKKVDWHDIKDEIVIAVQKDNVDFISKHIDKNTQFTQAEYYKFFLNPACEYDAVEVIKYLDEKKLALWGMDYSNQEIIKAMKTALSGNSFKIFAYMFERISLTKSKLENFCKYAIKKNNFAGLKFLLEKDFGLFKKDAFFDPAEIFKHRLMMSAASIGNLEIVKYFVQDGSSTSATYHGKRVMDYACDGKSLEVVKYLIEQGIECYIGYYAGRVPEVLLNYLTVGNFVQSLCSGNLQQGREEAVTAIFEHATDKNPLVEFAVTSMKSYASKGGVLHVSDEELQKMQNMRYPSDTQASPESTYKETYQFLTRIQSKNLPDIIKNPLLAAASELVEEASESLKKLDAELLYLSGTILVMTTYSVSKEKTDISINELKEISDTHELFTDYTTPGFCTHHFANTSVDKTKKLSILAGFMKLYSSVRQKLEEMLAGKAVTHATKGFLTEVFLQCKCSKLEVKDIEDMLIEFQLSSPEAFYPKIKIPVDFIIPPAPLPGANESDIVGCNSDIN